MKTLIKNAKIVTATEILEDTNLLILDGIIEYIGKDVCKADMEIDADGALLLPGFVDLHCHGGDGYEFMDASVEEIAKIADFHLSHGTTSMLATTLASSDGELVGALDNLSLFLSERESSIVGAHLEGPWFNPEECGAQNPECIRAPREGEIRELLSRYPFIKRISAAPEIEGCLDMAREANDAGVLVSAAHTGADFATIESARKYGFKLMTHLYSGMRGVTRRNSFRVAGAVEAGLYFDDLFVEIIADGCPLPSELLRYIYKIKGSDRVALITDAIRAAGMPDGAKTKIGSIKAGLDVIVEDGVAKLPDRQSFAGSAATADRLYNTMLKATGCGYVEASRMSSLTPARILGLSDRGEIAAGKRADLLLATESDEGIKIDITILGGILQ